MIQLLLIACGVGLALILLGRRLGGVLFLLYALVAIIVFHVLA